MTPIVFRARAATRANSYPTHTDPRLQPLIAAWRTVFPDAQPVEGLDFEDWTENATRLAAALNQAPDRLAVLDDDCVARYLNGTPVVDGATILFLGTWHRQDEIRANGGVFARYRYPEAFRAEISLAERYAESATFLRHAGRSIDLCGYREEPEDRVALDFFECLVARGAAGTRNVFIKVNLPKYGITRLELPESGDDDSMRKFIIDEHESLAWTMIHLAGQDRMLQVQDDIPMGFEYRVLVVNHQPAAGAGCVEAFTPLDNEATWDPKVEQRRNDKQVVHRTDLAERYRVFAQQFAAEYAAERPESGNYTLDLAISNDRIVVIELNPPQNYGLYAMDYPAVLRALLT